MIQCPRCGFVMQDGSPYCPQCGVTFMPQPAIPSAQTGTGPFYPQQDPPPAERRRRRQDRQADVNGPAPAAMERGYNRAEPSQPEEEKHPLPRPLVAALCILLVAAFALAGYGLFMRGTLNRLQQEKESAYREIVERHPLHYTELINKYSERYNLQPAFVCAIICNESSFNAGAESNKGARGLMQLMENTASWINESLNIPGYTFESVWDPETNIHFGCWYLSYLSKRFDGDPVLVACAYHAGQNNVMTWLDNRTYSADGQTLTIENIPMENTKTYVGRVIRDYALYDALYFRAFNDEDTDIDPPGPLSSDAGSGSGE